MSEALKVITPWIAVITAVIAGYFTFRNQMRLKAFELLLERRNELLRAVEDRIEFYRKVLAELKTEKDGPNLERFCHTNFHESLILFHRAKGVALGPLADTLIDTYWSSSQELITSPPTKEEITDIIKRMINGLVVFYGFAHSRISTEIESLTLSPIEKINRLFGIKEKLKEAIKTDRIKSTEPDRSSEDR